MDNGLKWPHMGPGVFFPANPDLADMLGNLDLVFDIFLVFVGFQISKSRFPEIQNLARAWLGLGQVWAGWACCVGT